GPQRAAETAETAEYEQNLKNKSQAWLADSCSLRPLRVLCGLCAEKPSRIVRAGPADYGRGRLVAGEGGEQAVDGLAPDEEAAVRGPHEAVLHRAVHERHEGREVAFHVQQADRLAVDAELAPGDRLEQLVERAEAPGQRDESVGH